MWEFSQNVKFSQNEVCEHFSYVSGHFLKLSWRNIDIKKKSKSHQDIFSHHDHGHGFKKALYRIWEVTFWRMLPFSSSMVVYSGGVYL